MYWFHRIHSWLFTISVPFVLLMSTIFWISWPRVTYLEALLTLLLLPASYSSYKTIELRISAFPEQALPSAQTAFRALLLVAGYSLLLIILWLLLIGLIEFGAIFLAESAPPWYILLEQSVSVTNPFLALNFFSYTNVYQLWFVMLNLIIAHMFVTCGNLIGIDFRGAHQLLQGGIEEPSSSDA